MDKQSNQKPNLSPPKSYLKLLLIILAAVIVLGGGFTYWYVASNKEKTVAPSSSILPSASPQTSPDSTITNTNGQPSNPSNNQTSENSYQSNNTPDEQITIPTNSFEGEIGGIYCEPVMVAFKYPTGFELIQGNIFNQNPKAPAWLNRTEGNSDSNGWYSVNAQTDYYVSQTICDIKDDNGINTVINNIKNPRKTYKSYNLIQQPTKTSINGNTAIIWEVEILEESVSTPSHPEKVTTKSKTKGAIIINSSNGKFVMVTVNGNFGDHLDVSTINSDFVTAYDVLIKTLTFK